MPANLGYSSSKDSRDIRQRSRRRRRFSNVDNFRPEVDCGVISGMLVDPTSVKLRVKFGDLMNDQTVLEIHDRFTL